MRYCYTLILFILSVAQPVFAGNITVFQSSTDVTMSNGIVTVVIRKDDATIISYMRDGFETMNQVGTRSGFSYDWTSSAGFEKMNGCVFKISYATASRVDLAFVRNYDSTIHLTPVNIEIHYVLMANDEGVYTYSVAKHPTTLKHKTGVGLDLGSWRSVWWIGNDTKKFYTEKIAVDSVRYWVMPSLTDTYVTTGIKEIIKMTSGARNGLYDGKYEYSRELWDLDAYGFTSNVNNLGIWAVQGGYEYYSGGPTYQDLNAAAGIIHTCMNGVHYNSLGFSVAEGEEWNKVWGPYLLLITNKQGDNANWAAAKARAAADKAAWPHSWVMAGNDQSGKPLYPNILQRGKISGTVKLTDPVKPTLSPKDGWIGVTQISNSTGNWQFEAKNYQYWTKINADGTFTIPAVRPGVYSLFAFCDGVVEEFRMDNVTVTANATTNLGNIDWNIDRTGFNLAWEIGVPNRSSKEFNMGSTDYFKGFTYDLFRTKFSNPIEYNVAAKNWGTALCYAHSKYLLADSSMNDWNWNLNFNLKDLPATGNAKLTIAYASADHAQQWIYVNGKLLTTYYPPVGGGNALIRQSNHARYCFSTISIPVSKLVAGNNVITLLMPSNSGMVSHLMYDYISLELPTDCNGDINGTAKLDACGVCTGGNSPNQPCTDSLQAETACTVDGILSENKNPGFSGSGYVNTTNTLGASVSWVLISSSNQTTTLTFRYANGGVANRDGKVSINGSPVGTLSLPPTGDWTTWKLASVNVPLVSGANNLVVSATTANGLANLDLIYFSAGVSEGQCVVTSITGNTNTTSQTVYPSPTEGEIKWMGQQNWILINALGKELERGTGTSTDLSEYPGGVYFIKLGEKIYPVVKE